MGIFGGPKRKSDELRMGGDIDDVSRMITNPTNVRMSQVRMSDQSEQPVWKNSPGWGQEPMGAPQAPPQRKWEPEPEPEMAQPGYAPLFVKIDKYRNILSTLGTIKSSIGLLRNSFATLNEIDKARQQNMVVIQGALDKINKKLESLDAELIRPTGFNTNTSAEDYQDVRNVEATVADLKGQLAQLKSDLQQL